MRFFGVFVIASFILFDILYLLRTVLVYGLEIRVWMMRKSTNSALENAVEFAAMPLVLVYDVFIFLKSSDIYVHPLVSRDIVRVLPLQCVGAVFCVLSLVVLVLILCVIIAARDKIARKCSSEELITGGIFAYTRNPAFIAMELYAAGIALIYPTAGGLVSVALVCAGVHVHILAEEKYLLFKYGERYREYVKRTKRYIFA
jgi:protein-S-isoprenylcysteine O-methyltransferase Ste14